MNIEIRYLEKKDLDELKKDIVKMWSQHHLNNKSLISKNVLKNTDLHKYFRNSIERKKEFSLIALVDNEVAGIVRVEEEKLEDFFNYKKAYKVDDVVIKRKFQRKRVATSLLNRVKEIAKKKGISVLKARVYSFNEPAQRFFVDKGFDDLYSEYFCTVD